jgi:hypothetical protein
MFPPMPFEGGNMTNRFKTKAEVLKKKEERRYYF